MTLPRTHVRKFQCYKIFVACSLLRNFVNTKIYNMKICNTIIFQFMVFNEVQFVISSTCHIQATSCYLSGQDSGMCSKSAEIAGTVQPNLLFSLPTFTKVFYLVK